MSTNRELLFGLLALQCGFISKDQLVAAMTEWSSEKHKPIEVILVAQNALTSHQLALLRQLEEELLAQHDQSAEQSLAALSSIGSVRQALEGLADAQLNATLAHVAKNPEATSAFEVKGSGKETRRDGALRYRTIRLHAKGGLGEVFVAKDEELNREVALKEIQERFADHDESRARFKQEAEITGNLEHPGIVPVYGLGQYEDGRPYYAMRFIRGDSLKEAIDAFHEKHKNSLTDGEAGLELRKLLRRFVDVCNAMAYAHSRGVLHRDLKPGNIILGKYGETLVVDWGLAKAQGQSESTDASIGPVTPSSGSGATPTMVGSAVGTPAYMSPEQAAGKVNELNAATDVYSLGATLFHLLTGQLPIAGKTPLEIVQKAENGEIRRPRELRHDVPKSLEAVCLMAMAKAPGERYSSPVALAEDIEKWLADEPVSAYVEPFLVRSRRWVRRHPAVVSTSAACVVLGLCAASVVAYLQNAHATQLAEKNSELTTAKNKAEAAAKAEGIAKVDAQDKQKLAETERARAEEREQEAIDAVKRFGDAVAGNPELKNSEKLKSLRKELLKEPLVYFKSLRERLQSESESRPASLRRLASAAIDLADLNSEIGDKEDAILAYQEATTIRARLAKENPRVAEYEDDLAASQNNLANLLEATGRHKEAREAFEAARNTYEQLTTSYPTSTLYWQHLATANNNLADLLSQVGELNEARLAHEAAKAIQERLRRENPGVAEYQSDLAKSHAYLGILLFKTGKPTEARSAFEAAKELLERLLEDDPTVTKYQSELAWIHHNLSILFQAELNPTSALEAQKKAKAIREQLSRENPTVTQYKSELALSQDQLGIVLAKVGRHIEALQAYEAARTINENLMNDHPTVTDYQRHLADTNNNLGILYKNIGKPNESRKSYDAAVKIHELLVKEHPNVTEYQSRLAMNLGNLGVLLDSIGDSGEAQKAFEAEKAILERLAMEHPKVIDYQSSLASSHYKLGNLFRETGKFSESRKAYEAAKVIQKQLTHEHPTAHQYQIDLSMSHYNLGLLLSINSEPVKAMEEYAAAKTIYEQLVREFPAVTQYEYDLASSYINMAALKFDLKDFQGARDFGVQAIVHQKLALSAEPHNSQYRQYLKACYSVLQKVAEELQDAQLVAETRKESLDLVRDDPEFAELDKRLTSVASGEPAKDSSELVALGIRAYAIERFALSARFYSESMDRDPAIRELRTPQHAYNGACSAALASSGLGDSPPEEMGRVKLRGQALAWLKSELEQWQKYLEKQATPEAKQTVVRTLNHWQKDSDLASVREAEKLAVLPEAERKEWEALWAKVKEMLTKVEGEVNPEAK